jgi:hypothetical protein
MANSVPGQLLNAIKARKFGTVAKLFAPQVDFQAWTPYGHWSASDAATVGKIIETWYTPGTGSVVTFSTETATAKSGMLECEVSWKIQPDDQVRVLRQVYLLTLKGEKITAARVYCAGLHTEFPEVDLEKQRRSKGLAGPKPPNSPKAVPAKTV